MTLAHAIAKAQSGAESLRQKATVPFTPSAERALLVEQSAAIMHLTAVIEAARDHLGSALAQSVSSDDQIIMQHVRDAFLLLGGRLEWFSAQERYVKPAPSSEIAAAMLARDPMLTGLDEARADADLMSATKSMIGDALAKPKRTPEER